LGKNVRKPQGVIFFDSHCRDSRLSYSEDPESLSHLGFVYHRVVTDGQTDRQNSHS